MIFNVLSILGACYVFLTIGEFFYSLIHKIPPLLDRRGGEATTATTTTSTTTTTVANKKNVDCTKISYTKTASSMTDSVDTCNDKELYQSELRKRRKRIAAGEVKGFLIGDHQKQNEIDDDEDRAILLSHDGTSNEGGQQMNRSNNINPNVFGSSHSLSSYVLSGQEHWPGESAGISMVGYYDSPPCGSGGIITAVRTVAPQPSPQLSFEVEHHNQQHHRQNRQQLKVNYSPVVSQSDSRSSLDLIPVKLLTTNSSSSLASAGSPFKISENSAFRPVHRTPSLDRDTQISNSSAEPLEPAKITIVMRNNNLATTQKANEAQPTTAVDHLTATSQRYSVNLGNNERKHSFSSSSPTVWSFDQPVAGGSHNHQNQLTSKLTSVAGHTQTVPQTFHHLLPDTVTEESVIKLKSTFHDFNKTADGFNPTTFSDKHVRPKKELFSIEKINSVPQLDTYSPLLTPKLLQQSNSTFAHLNNNNYSKKPDDDIGMALPGALRSAARLHKPSSSVVESSPKPFAFGHQGEIPSSKYPYPEIPVKKQSPISGSATIMGSKSFEEKMFQAMQPSPTLTSRPIMKPHTNGVEPMLNADNIAKAFALDKIKPSENLARWQAEKLEYKKFRGHLSSTSSDKDGQFDLPRDDMVGEQILFQTEDILKAGNVVAKAKLFESIAESEKQLLDEKDVYKRRSGRKKTDRAHTMLVSPRYLAPELYLDSFETQIQNDSYPPATTSSTKFGHFDYHQRSPSPLSSSDHEDEKSKMTMIEKAKLFETKVDGVNGGSSRSAAVKPEDRRKTQPVTQDELAKARTVLVKSIGNSMTGQTFNSNEDLSHAFAKVSEYSPRPLPGPRQKNKLNVQARFVEQPKTKPTNAVKPRKTVHLHTDQLEKYNSSSIAEDDQQHARLTAKFIEEETFVNGLTSFERPKPKRRHSMLNRNNFHKLRESEL